MGPGENRVRERTLNRYIINACIRAANARGWKDAVGVLHGSLFLACEPMSLGQLAEETGYSKTTVRLNMNLLSGLGLVRRVVLPGEKRFWYVLETDSLPMRRAVMANMRCEVRLILAALDLTEKELDTCQEDPDDADNKRARQSISRNRRYYEKTDRLLSLLAEHSTEELIDLLENTGKSGD
ncbi:Putative HTH-type transcriptional regulator [uncultured archaeon]|nr:Putative HTH-type transcriptional regulator [uncultured archaeon]